MRRLKYWMPVLIWMAVIFIFSNRTRVAVSPDYVLNFLFFKSLHVGEYAFLFVLCFRAIKNTLTNLSGLSHTVASFMLTVAYASTDEVHQLFIPTREGRMRDVIIDALGAVIAWIILYKLLPKAPRKLQTWAKKLDLL